MSVPQELFLTDFHAYRWGDGIEVELEALKDGGDSFSAHTTIMHRARTSDDNPTLLSEGRVNFSAPQTLTTLAKTMHSKRAVSDPDWHDRLLHVAHYSRKAFLEGSSVLVHADEIEVDYDQPANLLPPLIAGSGVTLWYADSSVGKTMVAEAAGLSIVTGVPFLGLRPTRTGTAIYNDWEDDEQTFRERVAALCAGAGIEVPHNYLYRQMDRSAGAGEARIRREAEEEGAALVIFDSVGEMLGGDPSDPVLVIPAVNVMKRLGCPALALHHISAEQAKSTDLRDKQKGYGSVYIRSGARLQWYFDRFQEEEADEGVLYAHNTKVNRGKKSRSLSWMVEYENGANEHLARLRYSTRSASDYLDRLKQGQPVETMTVRDALEQILRTDGNHALSVEALHKRVEVALHKQVAMQTVRNKLADGRRDGVFASSGEGKEQFWGLLNDRPEPF